MRYKGPLSDWWLHIGNRHACIDSSVSGRSDGTFSSSVFFSDLHHGQLLEHRLLLSEGGQRPPPDDPDRHVQLQQPQQQAAAPGVLADQGLL